MANFNDLTLTASGVAAMLETQAGKQLVLSKIGLGSGTLSGSSIGLTDLVTPELMLPISEKKIDTVSNFITLVAKMTNETVETGFYWRETGLFFQDENGDDVLFAYANAIDKYDYIPAFSDKRYIKHIRIANIVTDAAEITVQVNEGLIYVDSLTFAETVDEIELKIQKVKDDCGIIISDDGTEKIKFGKDEIGLYYELVE